MNRIQRSALNEVLCCPVCKGKLLFRERRISCFSCRKTYGMVNGIFVLMPDGQSGEQEKERQIREAAARQHGHQRKEDILSVIAQHHCMPVMEFKAKRFRNAFSAKEWIIDVGCGSGYYWRITADTAKIICMDFAIANLLAAQTLLRQQENIIFVQADASQLPVQDSVLNGVWSVQVTQHFPDRVMQTFLKELQRSLKDEFLLEIYNLNPDVLHRFIYRLFGKSFHTKGFCGDVLINKFNGIETRELWKSLKPAAKKTMGYSELFFHLDFHLRPQMDCIGFIDNVFASLPWLASLFARQICIRISS